MHLTHTDPTVTFRLSLSIFTRNPPKTLTIFSPRITKQSLTIPFISIKIHSNLHKIKNPIQENQTQNQLHLSISIMAHDQEQEPAPQQFPLISASYRLLDEIGNGVSAVVYKAECTPLNSTLVAIKSIDLDQSSKADFDSVRRESKTMSLLSHPNILKAHCSFLVDRRLWVVMPFMSSGSLQSIVSSSFQDGLTEPCIAIVLKETLKALCYLHDQGHLHRDIKAGNILVDSNGSVKLADFGVSASIYESNLSRGSHSASSSSSTSSSMMLTDVAGTPYWMAPEVIHSHNGYSYKADIWSFGITALELAHGRPPLSDLPPSKSLMMKLTKRFRFSDYDKSEKKDKNKKKFSKSFKEMVKSCLDQDPSKRPTAEKLLRHSFFKNCRSSEFLVRNVLLGLPSVEQRFNDAKLRRLGSINRSSEEEEDDDHHDQEGCSSMGVRTKNRRISGWNLNEDGFELDPVFPSEILDDTVVKQVRFGGEMIIKDREMVVGAESDHELEETTHSLARVVEGEVVEEEAHEQAQDQAQTQGQAQDQTQIQDQAHELAQEGDEVNGDPAGQGEAEGGSSVGSCIVSIADGLENEEAQTIAQAQDQAHEGDHGSEAGGEGSNVNVVPNNETMLGGLLTLKRSLDEQRQNVMLMINVIGGEEALAAERNREEQMRVLIERLSLQLEQEKHKNFELEMELQYYKL